MLRPLAPCFETSPYAPTQAGARGLFAARLVASLVELRNQLRKCMEYKGDSDAEVRERLQQVRWSYIRWAYIRRAEVKGRLPREGRKGGRREEARGG